MKPIVSGLSLCALAVIGAVSAPAQAQRQLPTPAQAVRNNFSYLSAKILEMAKDFPAEKYDFAPTKEVRTFGAVIVHVLSGNDFGARAGRGEDVKWENLEQDVKSYKSKAEIVAALKKSIDDATATLKATPDDHFKETLAPWMSIIEHAGEHYGQLVVYYRVNGLVPPESRPKSK